MALKTLLDSEQFGELDESIRDLYRETENGNYALDVEDIGGHPEFKKLREKRRQVEQERDEERKRAQKLQERFAPLVEDEELDLSTVDPERAKELMPYLTGEQELPKAGDQGPARTPEQDEKIRENARKPLEKENQKLQERNELLERRLKEETVNRELASELERAGVEDPDYRQTLVGLYSPKGRISIDEENGNTSALINSEFGEVPISEFVKEWKESDYAKKFIGASRNNGGGAPGSSSSAKGPNPFKKETYNFDEQMRLAREEPERANRLAAEAGKPLPA